MFKVPAMPTPSLPLSCQPSANSVSWQSSLGTGCTAPWAQSSLPRTTRSGPSGSRTQHLVGHGHWAWGILGCMGNRVQVSLPCQTSACQLRLRQDHSKTTEAQQCSSPHRACSSVVFASSTPRSLLLLLFLILLLQPDNVGTAEASALPVFPLPAGTGHGSLPALQSAPVSEGVLWSRPWAGWWPGNQAGRLA